MATTPLQVPKLPVFALGSRFMTCAEDRDPLPMQGCFAEAVQ